MSRRNWLTIFTLVALAIFCSSARAQQTSRQTKQYQEPQVSGVKENLQRDQNLERLSIPVRIIENKNEAAHKQEQETKTEKHDAEDLQAQKDAVGAARRAADAAETQTLIAYIQLVFAVVGGLGVIYSLYYTRKATIAATRNAQAAIDTVLLNRAWMTSDTLQHSQTSATVDGMYFDEAFVYWFEWKNTGSSPAISARILADHKIIGPNDPIPHFDPEFDPSVPHNGVAGAGTTVSSSKRIVPGDVLQRGRRTGERLFLYSKIEYRTVFDRKEVCVSEVCGEALYFGNMRGPDGRLERAIHLNAIGPQNGNH